MKTTHLMPTPAQPFIMPSPGGSRIVVETLVSEALRDNPLGDPHVRSLPVYLPPGYEQGTHSYPTVYFLAPFMGSGVMELNTNPFDETLQTRLDRLIHAGQLPPMIVVLPDPMTRYGGSQFLNSSAVGRYSDYLLEVVQWVDTHYHTKPTRDHRALMGKSSGGYGALMHAMRYPELFGLVADHSGDKDFATCYPGLFSHFVTAASRHDVETVLQNPAAFLRRGGYVMELFLLLGVPAMCAAYSPNPSAPLGFDWVMDRQTGERNPLVWRRWLELDPLQLADSHRDALKGLRLLYLDAGTRDEFNLHLSSQHFSERLSSLGIRHRYEPFEGGHSRTQFRFDVSLQAIGAAFAD